MIDLLEKAGYVLLTWTALSLAATVVWSKFMSRLHRKDHALVVVRQRSAWSRRIG